MNWATPYIEKLQRGETVTFRPRGHSMTGRVNDGQLVTVIPVNIEQVENDDIVLCRVAGYNYLHIVRGVKEENGKRSVMIGNARGKLNGWTSTVYGRCVKVE